MTILQHLRLKPKEFANPSFSPTQTQDTNINYEFKVVSLKIHAKRTYSRQLRHILTPAVKHSLLAT